jgi:hypothetical protein
MALESAPKRRKITLSLEYEDDNVAESYHDDNIISAWKMAAASVLQQNAPMSSQLKDSTQSVRKQKAP